jgi:DNA primase
MADDHVTEEIKARLDLAEYIGKQVPLKRAGRTMKALCPFHTEKTPSFVVFPHTQTWHCFGCGEGGDIFNYVMKLENVDFSEALRMLAREAGVTLRQPTEEEVSAARERDRLQAIVAEAAKVYHQWLVRGEEGARAREYLKRRQIESSTAERFQLGYAPARWDALLNYLSARGFKPSDLEKAGLVMARDGGGYYDRFRDRLLFPIRDPQGTAIGFGGRALDDSTQPKYLNSPQTPLFDKGRVLYGLDLAKDAIRSANEVVIVEGYMDVLTAHQRGMTNVIASMGTALTKNQFRQLKRLTRNLVFALDADQAGAKATQRGLELAREAMDQRSVPVLTSRGLVRQEYEVDADIRVLVLPEGLDPDDLIKQQPEAWEKRVRDALPVVDYLFFSATQDYDPNSPKEKSRLTKELLPVVADILDPVQRAHYLQRLAGLVHVDEEVLRQELARTQRRHPEHRKREDRKLETRPTAPLGIEEYCLFLLLLRPSLFVSVEQYSLRADDFRDVKNRELFRALTDRGSADVSLVENPLDEEAFRVSLDPVVGDHLSRIVHHFRHQPPLQEQDLVNEMEVSIQKLKLRNEQEEAAQIRFMLRDLDEQADPLTGRTLQERINELNARIRERERDLFARTYVGRRERAFGRDREMANS